MEFQIYPSMVYYANNIEPEILSTDDNAASMVIIDETEVMYQSDEYCDINYLKENNIKHFQLKSLPHTHCIVCVKGNVMISIKRKPINGRALSDFFIPAFCDFLKDKGLNAVIDNNDILIDGYKVSSGTEGEIKGWRYFGYQISVNQDIDLISTVCKKEMVKTPKGLSEFGVTTEQVVDFCNNFWEKY